MRCENSEIRPEPPYDFSTHLRSFSVPGRATPIIYDSGSNSMRYLLRIRKGYTPVRASFKGEPAEPVVAATSCSARAGEALGALREVIRAGFRWSEFLKAVEPYPRIAALARKYPGVRPGRCLWLYEALVDTVIEQRIALKLALRIKAGLVEALGPREVIDGEPYYGFPPPEALIAEGPEGLRRMSLTRVKARAIYEVAVAEVEERLPSLAEVERDPWGVADALTELYGVGAWTAELAVAKTHPLFPIGPHQDLAVRRGLERSLGIPPDEALEVVDSLGDYAGLVMYLAALDYELGKGAKGSPRGSA